MRKINFLTGLLAFAFIFTPVLMQADDYKKSYSESYKVNKDAELVINNKYGDLHIQNWDKNEVSIEVTVTVETSSESKAQRVLDGIEVEISGGNDRVEAITNLTEKSMNNIEFSIDYRVMKPSTLQVSLVNKFGEIYLEEVKGEARIELAYGEIEATALRHPDSFLDLKFSEAEIEFYGGKEISISYSELDIEEAMKLKLLSRFSEAGISRAEALELDSQYDEITVGTTGDINATTRFSEVTVEELSGNFTFDAQYGEVSVEMIRKMTGTCEIENSFADVNLTFSPDVSFELDATAKFGDVSYPKSNADVDHTEEGFTTNKYRGRIGSGAPGAKLVIVTRNSDVRISY